MALDTVPATPASSKPKRSEGADLMVFLLKLAIVVFIIRSFLFSPFSIPSGSMQPRLLIGDYLFITKWNYGYSRYSLPWNLPLIPGRILPRTPARGDVVVFKAPPTARQDYIKRVIGIPGDTVQMRGGQLFLNGKAISKQRMPDFVVPVSPNTDCAYEFQRVVAEKPVCAYPQFRETLPGGKSYNVLDLGTTEADDTGVFTVPTGHAFLMGDNRDDSADSRFPAREGGGIGIVPLQNIEGKAVVNFFSTDGSAQWLLPWTWVSAARWSRIGEGF
ncbi:S26 family signal peptidase [Sphingomonas sp. Leaf24]|uniref:signal peptidase I n=1 Tax=unclassified Sphingomonas TaxID=196159 RepID=UPI0006F79076|nr:MULTISPECIES: signal peptidase I [unclassified Sphingomonas]KQM22901.1 S26 family signal peptidase [Sphingomonas sp. Leaf5]KQM95757.1 S26 family signal peptidase [Sphingomonas sp. Leaf24]KQN91855.1 S26 family signal peptidase [Sphingomonas sp. Leaf67]